MRKPITARAPGVAAATLGLWLAAPWQAGAAEPLLAEAWRGVVAHSPDYAAAIARRDAGLAAADAARALWLPTVAAQGGLARRSLDTETTGAQFSAPGLGTSNGVDFRTSTSGGTDRQWAFMAQQPLIDAARVADASALKARARMAGAQFDQSVQALMVRTAETLAQAIQAAARFEAVQRQRESAMRARDEARARFDSGDLPVTEWREAQAQADQLAVAELDAQQALAIANEAWSNLTGLPPPAPSPVDATDSPVRAESAAAAVQAAEAPAREAPRPLEDWLATARVHSPMLRLQEGQRDLADAESRRWSRVDGLQLSLVGQLGRERLAGSGDFGESGTTQRLATVGVQATLPLFTGGMRTAQRRMAEGSARAAAAELDAARQQLDLQVRSAWLSAGNAHARLGWLRQAGESAASRLDATRVGHEAGDRTLLDLLSAQGAALQARAGVVAARCEGLVATLRLAAAAGTLDEAALRDAAAGEFTCGEAR